MSHILTNFTLAPEKSSYLFTLVTTSEPGQPRILNHDLTGFFFFNFAISYNIEVKEEAKTQEKTLISITTFIF